MSRVIIIALLGLHVIGNAPIWWDYWNVKFRLSAELRRADALAEHERIMRGVRSMRERGLLPKRGEPSAGGG